MDIFSIKNFLQQINTVNSNYKKIVNITGENFNIFRILKMEASEVRLHSTFLAELLNPNGSHGQKALFLRLFIQHFKISDDDFETEGAFVEVEKHTGLINEDRTEGGRIDIMITDQKGRHIIIENKIYATDAVNQLFRYKQHSKRCKLFYLTLDGREPSQLSTTGLILGEDYSCISYKNHIVTWLESCRKEVSTLPIIRETITQYIHLIKHLNNQSINNNMASELSSLINSNIEAAFLIANNLDIATNELLYKFKSEMYELAEELEDAGFELYDDFDIKNRYTGFYFFKPRWKHCSIGFSFQNFYKDFYYGIVVKENPVQKPIPLKLKEDIESLVGVKSKNSWWPIMLSLESPYNQNWEKSFEPWEAIANGKMKAMIKRKLFEMIKLIGDLKL